MEGQLKALQAGCGVVANLSDEPEVNVEGAAGEEAAREAPEPSDDKEDKVEPEAATPAAIPPPGNNSGAKKNSLFLATWEAMLKGALRRHGDLANGAKGAGGTTDAPDEAYCPFYISACMVCTMCHWVHAILCQWGHRCPGWGTMPFSMSAPMFCTTWQ